MGLLESLQGLLGSLSPDEIDITVFGDDIDVGDISEDAELRVKSGEHHSKAVIANERVVLYPNQLQGKQYAKFLQLVGEVKREQGKVTRLKETNETKALEGTDTVNIDQIITFFDGVISDRHLSLLKSALYLRQLSSNNRQDTNFHIDQKKSDLKERYGYEAYYVSHLASSGYFDEGRYFQNLYYEFEEGDRAMVDQYREEFEQLIGEKLIATFVNSEDGMYEVKSDVKAGLAKHYRYQPRADFFDVCGMGSRCRDTINSAIDDLCGEFGSMQYDSNDRQRERVVRIYPGSLQDFGL